MDKTNKYLFVAIPNNSGSTMMASVLGTSPHAASLYMEGQHVPDAKSYFPSRSGLARRWSVVKNELQDESNYDWDKIKEAWHKLWAMCGPNKTVFVEKSPPNVMRAEMMQRQFENSFFVLGIRNPYAYAMSMKSKREDFDIDEIMDHWISCAQQQLVNQEVLKNKIFIRYEDFCTQPIVYCKRLVEFIPELEYLPKPTIRQANIKRYRQLNNETLKAINEYVRPNAALLAAFGYPVIEKMKELRSFFNRM